MFLLLNETFTWWHWILLGIILLIIEINIGTFFILGLGLSAIFVGVFSFFIPLGFIIEICIFSFLSLLIILLHFRQKKRK
ncbi:Putative activity regulator of membrane protease YbbK [hydrothermal vent metagenome]|uniref:Putative activity regulator of membrane protease YbbK n=1 Tax=hydrothermal vent metagenome TaxID=652676 RepID=A0A1W1BPQ7_9ZZZZ